MRKERITGGRRRLTFVVNELPTRAGIDPFNKLIDRNWMTTASTFQNSRAFSLLISILSLHPGYETRAATSGGFASSASPCPCPCSCPVAFRERMFLSLPPSWQRN